MNQVHQQQQQQSMLYNAAGQPVSIALPPPTTAYELYDSGQSFVAGIILIVVGVLSIVVNGVGIGIGEGGTMTGQGIVGGVLFIITGAFGVAAAKKNRCQVITFLVFAILSTTSAGSVLAQSAFGSLGHYHHSGRVGIAGLILSIVAVVASAIAIWGSVLGCKVACCGRPTLAAVNEQPLVIVTHQPYVSVPQVDPAAAAPPAYVLPVDDPMMPSKM